MVWKILMRGKWTVCCENTEFQSRLKGGGEALVAGGTSGIVSCTSVWDFRTAEFQEENQCNSLLKPFITVFFSFKKCWFNVRLYIPMTLGGSGCSRGSFCTLRARVCLKTRQVFTQNEISADNW